jgi:urease accessory protein
MGDATDRPANAMRVATPPAEGRIASDRSKGQVELIGRVGDLTLAYERRGAQTVLARSYSRSPWHLFPPIDLDDSGCAYTLLVNPSGGLVAGDHLCLQATLGPDTHVLFSTPSATKVYRSLAEPSCQTIDLVVGQGAILEWLPEPTIPFAGSRFHQTIRVRLESQATLLLWDAIASGRMARGERWAFRSLTNDIRITTASGPSIVERYELASVLEGRAGEDPAVTAGLAGEWDYVASLFLLGDGLPAEKVKRLADILADILASQPGQVLGGISEPAAPGLAIKLLAKSAPALGAMQAALWAAVRTHLWGLPVPALRRY